MAIETKWIIGGEVLEEAAIEVAHKNKRCTGSSHRRLKQR